MAGSASGQGHSTAGKQLGVDLAIEAAKISVFLNMPKHRSKHFTKNAVRLPIMLAVNDAIGRQYRFGGRGELFEWKALSARLIGRQGSVWPGCGVA